MYQKRVTYRNALQAHAVFTTIGTSRLRWCVAAHSMLRSPEKQSSYEARPAPGPHKVRSKACIRQCYPRARLAQGNGEGKSVSVEPHHNIGNKIDCHIFYIYIYMYIYGLQSSGQSFLICSTVFADFGFLRGF